MTRSHDPRRSLDQKAHRRIQRDGQAGRTKDAARLFFSCWVHERRRARQRARKWIAEGRKTAQSPPVAKSIAAGLKVRSMNSHRRERRGAASRFQGGCRCAIAGIRQRAEEGDREIGRAHSGAVNLPWTLYRRWRRAEVAGRSADDLQLAASARSPVITYCNTGRSASTGYLVLRLLGYDSVAVYDGSMSDWTASGARPVEKIETK